MSPTIHPKQFSISHPGQQRGAVLVIGMLILLVMTILGVTSMSTSTLQEKMAGNNKDRTIALQGAEDALRDAELLLQTSFSTMTFDTDCTGGYCDCALDGADLLESCEVEYWTDATKDVWNTSTKHMVADNSNPDLAEKPKYIIEYIGKYYDPDTDGFGGCASCPNLYRITAMSTGISGRAKVAIQSTFMIDS